MTSPFQHYAVTGEEIRQAAAGTRRHAGSVNAVNDEVARVHEKAVAAAEGSLQTPVNTSRLQTSRLSEGLTMRALWASVQLEDFADTVDGYNIDRTADPRCVDRLNAQWERAEARSFGWAWSEASVFGPVLPGMGTADRTDLATQAPDLSGAPPIRTQTAEGWDADPGVVARRTLERDALFSELESERSRGEDLLDAAAARIDQNLQHEPTDEDLRTAWKAGNLPLWVAQAMPRLGLALGQIPDRELERRIREGGIDPLTMRLLLQQRPELAKRLPGLAITWHGNAVGPDGRAIVTGPDGGSYPVEVPCGEQGWRTVGYSQQDVRIGEPGPAGLGFFAGRLPPHLGYKVDGSNPSSHLKLGPDGKPVLGERATAPSGSAPEPFEPPGKAGNEKMEAAASGVDALREGIAREIEQQQRVENAQTYAVCVQYQVNDLGERRAVMTVAQPVTYADGTTGVRTQPATIDGQGNLVPIGEPSYSHQQR